MILLLFVFLQVVGRNTQQRRRGLSAGAMPVLITATGSVCRCGSWLAGVLCNTNMGEVIFA
jgi:hypothetical protein